MFQSQNPFADVEIPQDEFEVQWARRNLPVAGEISPPRETPGFKILTPSRREMIVPIAGLNDAVKQNPACIAKIAHEDVENYLKRNTDTYEITWMNPDTICRAYLDVDGVMAPDTEEVDFEMRDEAILEALQSVDLGTPFSIMTASKFGNIDWKSREVKHKLSYRLTFTNKCGTQDAVKYWALNVAGVELAKALQHIIPFYPQGKPNPAPEEYLDCDKLVYSPQRKMRCWNATKPGEKRPNRIVRGSLEDCLITLVPEGCEMLSAPPAPPAPTQPAPAAAQLVVATPADASIVQRVLDALPAYLSDDYSIWLSIGMACFNEDLPCEVWDKWSSQSRKYRKGDCAYRWTTFRKGTITQAYLWSQLKKCDPVKFKELIGERKDFDKLIENPTHYAVAEFFYNTCPHDYLFDTNSGWFGVLPSGVWENPKGKTNPPTMKNKIVRTLNNERIQLEAVLCKKKRNINNDERSDEEKKNDLEALDKKSKKLLEFRDKYESDGFQKGVIAFLAAFYSEQTQMLIASKGAKDADGAIAIFDTNPNVWAFTDCLFDFSTMEFRPIKPTDYITITCGYARPKHNEAVRQKIMETMVGIWEDGEMAKYTLGLLSICLNGTRSAEVFTILTGRGGNGKGLLWELVQRAFGGYYYQLPVAVLTKKVDSSTAATPDIANLRGMRCVGTSEPEAEERLQEGTVKLFTGGDPLTGRPLYGQPFTFKPQFGLFIQCNNIPVFNGITKGGVRRNRVIPFPFNFVATPKMSYDRVGDPHIKNVLCRTDEWRDEFLLILMDLYEDFAGKQIDQMNTPAMVQQRTDQYVEENNRVGVWWNEHYEVSEGSIVRSSDAITAYRDDTKNRIDDRTFKAALAFNDIDIEKLTKNKYLNATGVKGCSGIVNWRRKEVVEPVDGEEEEE